MRISDWRSDGYSSDLLGNEDGVMPHEMSPGKPTTKRYSEAEKQRAVRAVRQLRKELGTEFGTIKRVAEQLGIGEESLRKWVKQYLVDTGEAAGVTSEQAERIKALEIGGAHVCTPVTNA